MNMVDIKHINYILFTLEERGIKKSRVPIIGRGIIYAILSFVIQFIKSFFTGGLKFKKQNLNYKGILFYGHSKNNKDTLQPIINKLNNEEIVTITSNKDLPKWRVFIYSIPYFFNTIHVSKSSDPKDREIIKSRFVTFWTTYGFYKLGEKMLDFYNPKVIILANDHNPFQRCIIDIAHKRNIKTIYTQHASISDVFPPLSFSYSFLDGQESLEKYLNRGKNTGCIFLSGGVRFDTIRYDYKEKKQGVKNKYFIGLAINALDNLEKAKRVSLELQNKIINDKQIVVIIRPHPQYSKKSLFKWSKRNNIMYSDSRKETSFQFLEKVNILISNESSIHLDAIIAHKYTLLYNFSNNPPLDWYGYEKQGLVKRVKNTLEITDAIKNIKDFVPNEETVRYYAASYGTKHEGKVAIIIAALIENIISGNDHFTDDESMFRIIYSKSNLTIKSYKENHTLDDSFLENISYKIK